VPTADLLGYADKLSVEPGETIAFMVSTEHERYRAEIVRFTAGPPRSGDAGITGPALMSGDYSGRVQPIATGSYVLVPDSEALRLGEEFTIQAWLWPTLPARGHDQGIVTQWSPTARAGFALLLDGAGRLALRLGDGAGGSVQVTAPEPLSAKRWVFVAASYGDGRARIEWRELPRSWLGGASGTVELACGQALAQATDVALLIGALALHSDERGKMHATGCYNGKIDRPRLWRRRLQPREIDALAANEDAASLGDSLIADWDFSANVSSTVVTDRSPHGLHGQTVNMPARAVTGHTWDGNEDSFLVRPDQYGAIAFHEDDLEDCRWDADFSFTVPPDTPTGVYAARLIANGEQEEIPFYVRPARGAVPAPILYLAPTNTYLAYANFRMNIARAAAPGADPAEQERLTPTDHLLIARPDLAGSVYDVHPDGSGICYSSRLRPVVTLRSQATENLTAAPRHFSADLYLTEWLDRLGLPYDVATDEGLHREGRNLLTPYQVILTGSHPEYWTTPMLDALEAYLAQGGRLIYLGGNGFYWVTAMDESRPHLVEVRRGLNGTRSWTSEPGESRLSLTGEIGGLWRNRGRFPNQLVGVGFASQGWDAGGSYTRLTDSCDPRAVFIFAGVGDDERIGDFGIVGNGAAGDEVDRYDLNLGTPPETLRLATSEGQHSDAYQLVIEDTGSSQPTWGGSCCPLVRADLVYLETEGGGAVFSTGSINWIASLPHHGFANNVARITENVLRRFAGMELASVEARSVQ
jgi:N,N-dimethylformamidase